MAANDGTPAAAAAAVAAQSTHGAAAIPAAAVVTSPVYRRGPSRSRGGRATERARLTWRTTLTSS